MTPESILLKLTKRSTPATQAYDVHLAQGYSLADLTHDLMKLAMTEQSVLEAAKKADRHLRHDCGYPNDH